MRKLLTALCAVALVISACQKEPSYEDPNSNPGTGGNTGGTKLVRLGARVDDDSLTIDYSYNGLDRLSTIKASGIYNGEPTELQTLFNRNAANVITSAVIKSPFFIPAGLETDSVVVKYRYDQMAGHYLSAATHVVVDDEAQADSTVFDYEYAGNNLGTAKYYNFDDSGNLVLAATESFEYDSKTNPLQFADEAPALSILSFYGVPFAAMETYYSANNGTQQTIEDADVQEPYITLMTYSYNAANRPTRADGTDGFSTSTLSYYYQ